MIIFFLCRDLPVTLQSGRLSSQMKTVCNLQYQSGLCERSCNIVIPYIVFLLQTHVDIFEEYIVVDVNLPFKMFITKKIINEFLKSATRLLNNFITLLKTVHRIFVSNMRHSIIMEFSIFFFFQGGDLTELSGAVIRLRGHE